MKFLLTKFWKKRNGVIAAAAIFLILIHLILRFILRTEAEVYSFPLKAILFGGGLPLLYELILKMFRRKFSADFLAGLSIFSAFFLNEYLAGAIVVFMLSGGKALEDFALRNASSVLRALAKRMPSIAHRRTGKNIGEIAINDIKIGDILIIFPHEICPVDGVVTEGRGMMDEAYLTGEPFQISKTPGSEVISGSINGDTALTIKAEKIPEDSRYAKIVEVLRTSEKNKPNIRRLADRLGAWYGPLALAAACGAWVFSGDPVRFLAVLMVATPCPLLIGIPVAVIGSIALAAKRGIIVKNPAILEQIEECSIAIFDKTGTLTYGRPELSEIICALGFAEKDLLSLTATLERYSKHPLALAILEAAKKQNVPLYDAVEMREVPGQGLKGKVLEFEIQITGRKELSKLPISGSENLPSTAEGLECIIVIDGKYAALFRFRDTPRPEGLAFIKHLSPKHHLNRSMIISGDRESEVKYLAEKVGITEIYAGRSPEEKLVLVKAETLKAKTLYVGDGINDAPALMAATVGVAIGRNSDITSESAGAVVMGSSLAKIDELMHISHRMRMIALQSAIGGILLSFVGIILASTGYLTPVLGAMIQEGIDLLSILNALRAAFPPKALTDY